MWLYDKFGIIFGKLSHWPSTSIDFAPDRRGVPHSSANAIKNQPDH